MKNLYEHYLELINDGILNKLTPKQRESFLDIMRLEMKEQMFGDGRYFIEDGYIVKISDAPGLFIDLIEIRKATEEEIVFDNLYWKLYRELGEGVYE